LISGAFEKDSVDAVVLKHTGDLGDLESIEITKDHKGFAPSWYLESVAVKKVQKWLPPFEKQERWEGKVAAWFKGGSEKVSLKKTKPRL